MRKLLLLLFIILSLKIYSKDNSLNIGILYNRGYEFIDNNKLSDFLIRNSYYPISETFQPTSLSSLGFTISQINNPFIAQILFCKKDVNIFEIGNHSSINSYGININGLYNLSKNQKWIFAPMLGVGINNYNLIAISKDVSSSLSGSLLEESFQKNDVFGLKFGIDVERQIKIYNFNCNVGLNAYYNFDIGNINWKNSSQSVLQNIPSMEISSFSLLINVGVIF